MSRRTMPMPGPDEIAQIVGCEMVDGACVVHQPRNWEARRPGCPYLDSLMGHTGHGEQRTRGELAPGDSR